MALKTFNKGINEMWKHSQYSFKSCAHEQSHAGLSPMIHWLPAYLRMLMGSKPAQTAVKGCQNADQWLQVFLNLALTRWKVQTRDIRVCEGFCTSTKPARVKREQSWRCRFSIKRQHEDGIQSTCLNCHILMLCRVITIISTPHQSHFMLFIQYNH